MSEVSGRMSTMKKEGRTTEDWGMNWKEPQTSPIRNILTAFVTRLWNFKEQDVMTSRTQRQTN
jgi:hypothetical protein